MTTYTIQNQTNGLAWSNEFGWVDAESGDTFTAHERETLSLPIDGEWRSMGRRRTTSSVSMLRPGSIPK